MTLKQRLEADLKEAQKSRDELRRTTLRSILSAARNFQLEKRTALLKEKRKALSQPGPGQPRPELDHAALEEIEKASSLDESEYQIVLRREARACREAIADASTAGRSDLIARQQAELAIIEAYLPRQLSRDEIAARARAVMAEAGVSGLAAQGEIMKRLMPQLKGLADGRTVSEVVRELLARS